MKNFQMWLTNREDDYIRNILDVVQVKDPEVTGLKSALIKVFEYYADNNDIDPFKDRKANPLTVYKKDPAFMAELDYLLQSESQESVIRLQGILDKIKPGWRIGDRENYHDQVRTLIREVFEVE